MSLRHSILQENSQPRHMHRSTYDRKIWLLMTPSSLDGLTATYIYIPQLKKRSTFFALTVPSEWSPNPTYRLLVFPNFEPGLGYGNIRNRRSMDTNFHFWLVSRGHKHFSLDLGLLLILLNCWLSGPVGCAQPNSDPVQYVAWPAVPLWDPAVYPILWFLS